MYRRVARDFNADVEALRDRNREVATGDRRDGETIDGGQLAIELTEIDMISAHRGTVDDPQQHLPARLDLDHLGIG